MNQLSFTLLLRKHFGTKMAEETEYRFSRNDRYFAIRVKRAINRHTDEAIISEMLFFERIMPENENSLRDKVRHRLTGKIDSSELQAEEIVRWVTKQIARAVLLNEDAELKPAAAPTQ